MYATIQRWGNSQGMRIPKVLLDALDLRENNRVELTQTDGGIHIKKAPAGHRTLEDQLTAFYGKPVDEIPRLDSAEIDWGGLAEKAPAGLTAEAVDLIIGFIETR